MEENNERFLLYAKGIVVIIAYLFIGLFLLLFIGISKVDALEVRPSACVSASDNWSAENCSANEKTINNSNYVNVVTTYPSGLQEKTYNFSLYYDLYVKEISSLIRVNEYVKTPIVHVYIGNTEINSNAPTIIQTQRSWCDNGPCWRIRTFLTNFQWRGNLSNQSITWNIRSSTGNGGVIGWTNYSGVGNANLSGPYFQYGQSFAEYNDDTQQAVENQTSQMQEGFANINENNNRLTESINETITNKSNEVKDAIENQNKKCENYNYIRNSNSNNFPISQENVYLKSDGTIGSSSTSWSITDYIPINGGKNYTLTLSQTDGVNYCLYGSDKSLIGCSEYTNTIIAITPQVDGFIRLTVARLYSRTQQFTGEYCYNLLEKQNETQQQQYDYMTDSTPADYRLIEGIQTTDDTPISSLITFPIKLIQAFLQNLNGTCADVNFGQLYGTSLIFRCSDIRAIPNKLGNAYSIIDTIFCFFMIYNIFQLFVTAYNHITTLKDDFHEIYETRTYIDRSEL